MRILTKLFGLHESIGKWIGHGIVLLFIIGSLVYFYKYISGNDSDYDNKLQLSKDGISVMAKITKVGENTLIEGDDTKYADYEFEDNAGNKFKGNCPLPDAQNIPEEVPVIYSAKNPADIQFAGTQEDLKKWLDKYKRSDNLIGGVLTLVMGLLIFYGNKKGIF